MRLFKKKTRNMRLRAHDAVITNGQLILSGLVYTNFPEIEIRLVIRKFREAGFVFEAPITMQPLPLQKWGLRSLNYWRKFGARTFTYESKIEVPWKDLPSSVYTIEVEFNAEDPEGEMTLYRRRIRANRGFTELLEPVGDDNSSIHLFSDDVSKMLRIESFHWGKNTLQSLRSYKRKELSVGDRTPCVIGEYANTAKDNGKWLFETLRDNDLGIDPTYVIEKKNLGGYEIGQPNVVEYGSVEHLQKCIDAPIIAFSHSQSYIYPNVIKKLAPLEYETVKKFWLQHGVTALKHTVINVYKKSRANLDFIAVSSPLEQSVIVENFNYNQDQVLIVGFSRYDNLFRLAKEATREERILFFPTWRKGLMSMSNEEFVETDYFIQWVTAIKKVKEQTGMKAIMMVHPFLNHFEELFTPYADEVYLSNHFQTEVVRSSGLVTDYSSVCFDAIYAGKPVAFFHFDAIEYGFQLGALIDIETQMPGPIAETAHDLADNVNAFKQNDWSADGSAYQKLYFSNVDQKNSTRIAAAIVAAV